MKRIFIVVIVFLFACHNGTYGQVMGTWEPFLQSGLKVGVNIQGLSGAPVRSTPGAVAGIYTRKDIKRFGIRAELLGSFTQYTTKYPAAFYSLPTPGMDTTTKGSFTAIYVSVPLLVEFKLNSTLTALAGPQFSYLASLSDNNNAFTKIYGEGNFIINTDYSFVVGLGYGASKHVGIDLRVIKGVTDVNNSTYYLTYKKWSTTSAQLTVSYKIL